MLSFLQQTLQVLLLAILLRPVHAIIKFDQATCGVSPGSNPILDDVVNMANAAIGYMDNAQSGQQSNDPKERWNFYRVMTLFDVLFDAKHSDAQNRWNTVRNSLSSLAGTGGSSAPNVYVICDDTKFWTVSPSNGNPTVFNAPDGTSHQFSSAMTCADSANGAYQIAYRHQIGGVEYVALCLQQNTLPLDLSKISYQEGTDITATQTWSTSFFHEIMHVLPLNQRGDQSGGVGQGGERYGWAECYNLRSDYSPENPDSTKYFAMALSMEEWMWHTGTAVSFNAEYTRLDQNPADNTIQNLNLPSPAPGAWIP